MGLVAVVLFVWLFSLMDLWLQYGRLGRLLIWLILMTLLGACAWWVRRTLNMRLKSVSVAAMVEKTFPQLDNRLINYLQFSAQAGDDPFKRAYVSDGAPAWNTFNLKELKNSRQHKRALYALVTAVVLLLMPGAFLGQAWAVAIWRVVNPFANVEPAALTRILSVEPGDTTVIQGNPLVLICEVQGREGHKVSLDVERSDEAETIYALGKITGDDAQSFKHRLPKVNTPVRYRFRAGDAPFPKWYTVKTRQPLGFTDVRVTITPPAYTALPRIEYDASAQDMSVVAGSRLHLSLRSNLPIAQSVIQHAGEELAMTSGGDATAWEAEMTVADGKPMKLVALGVNGDRAEQDLRYAFLPDRLPAIDIVSPEGRPVLTRGAKPSMSFSVEDDHGLSEVFIEQVSIASAREAKGVVLKNWSVSEGKRLSALWDDDSWRSRDERTLAYRILARDNHPDADPSRVARSELIVFDAPPIADAARRRDALEDKAFSSLAKIIEMQRDNLSATKGYAGNLGATPPEQWQAASGVQREIREIMKVLLGNPLNPLGNLTSVGKKLYLDEMADVIPLLAGVPSATDTSQAVLSMRAVQMEEKILRQLTFADVSAAKSKVQRRVTALTGMLARLVTEQAQNIARTRRFVAQSIAVGQTLVDRQDELALDLTDFVHLCRKESAEVLANDENYALLLIAVADASDEKRIRDDMMLASEQLEENKPAPALVHEGDALQKLKLLQAMMAEVMAEDQLAEQEAMLEAILAAKARVAKVRDLHAKAIESMEMVKDQLDKSDKDVDMLEEEYEELVKKTKNALLQVPTDLNVFMELNVANDIAEDVFSVFEEIEQVTGSQATDKGDVAERAMAKREGYLEGMEEAMGRLDELEQWLGDKPDSTKFTAEPFDQEELPEAGISLGALKTEAEDLIGDLLEEDSGESSDDGAINSAVPDTVPMNEVREGDMTSFAAQGKSGNDTPDHKEQDGRANVGREGMAVGETAAGSGNISEGDKDIEERRTQDPTQSGQIDVEGEDIQTKATGGGKLGTGKADDVGMEGGVERMDSTEEGSAEGLEALMARQAETMFAKASMQNVRADSLKDAAHHLRQAADAVARGNIAQLKEHRRLALVAMKKAKAQMDAAQTGSYTIEEVPSLLDDVVDGGAEQAPPKYRDMVAEYYKILNRSL